MNRKGKKFDWDNSDLSELKVVDKQPKFIHPDIILEIPGIKTEDMDDEMIGPILIDEEGKSLSYAERAAKARRNTGLDIINEAQGINTKQDGLISIDGVGIGIDGNLVQGVFVKEDPIDRFLVIEKCDFPGQEMVNPGKNDQLIDKGETLGCVKRKIIPRMVFPPKPKCKTQVSKATTGAGFRQTQNSFGAGERQYSQSIRRRWIWNQAECY